MKTQIIHSWGPYSVSYWLTFLVAIGIIFIGVRFLVSPLIATEGYGIPLKNNLSTGYAYAKGIRDIYSGIILLVFLGLRKAHTIAILFSIASIIPAADFCIILTSNGVNDITHLLIHGCTTVYMVIVSGMLFSVKFNN